MELKRITGPDMRTALRLVREQLGPDAIILSNRRTAAGIEIVAGPEDALQAEPPAPVAETRPVATAAHAAPVERPRAPSREGVAAIAAPEVRDLRREVRDLRALLERRLDAIHDERLGWGPGSEGRAWRRLTRVGLPNAWVHELVRAIDPRAEWVTSWGAVCTRLAAGLLEAGDIAAGDGIVAVVGPTGAGKSTTLAKLAVRRVLQHGPAGLAIASLDATRIGGADMMRALARLLEVPFLAAQEDESIEQLIACAGPGAQLLIDTAGLAPRASARRSRLAELGALTATVRTLLVLPANAQPAWLDAALEDYRAARPGAAVITKIDETVSLGEALGAVHAAALPLAYVTDGPEIPDDLHVANAVELVARALALDPEAEDNGPRRPRARPRAVAPDNAARIA